MLVTTAGWIAPAATMIAAMMTAANLGARVTGWGFVVFTVGAVAWIIVASASGQQNLLLSNAFLLLVDIVGIWRWLGRKARYDTGAARAARHSARSDAPSLFALSTIEGRPITGADGATIGTAVDGMAACDSGGIAYLVISRGGVGGVGERLHALGWHEVRLDGDTLETRLDAAVLDRRPALDAKRWPATAEAAGVG